MSTSGGGWTYLMNPNIIGLNTYSLGMSSLLNYGGGTECLDVNIEKMMLIGIILRFIFVDQVIDIYKQHQVG